MKAIEQWRQKLYSKGAVRTELVNIDLKGVGDYIFIHLLSNSEFDAMWCQDNPVPASD